jgi:putative copper export protein
MTAPALARAADAWWRAWWLLAAIGATGLALALAGVGGALDVGAGDLGTLLFDTRWGIAWTVQVVALLVAVAGAATLRRKRLMAHAADPAAWGYALGAPPAVAAAAISWAGHASSGTDAGIGVAIDALHLLATGVWLGGLAGLLCVVPYVRRVLDERVGTRLVAAIVVRFSAVAITCVALLVVTGVYRAIAELRTFGDFVDTGYGRALLVKLILFGVLLAGGAVNRLVLHPRLERAALGLEEADRGAGGQLRVSVAAELIMATALLATVAVLVSLPPP